MAIVEIIKDSGTEANAFSLAVRLINESAVKAVERRDKGKPDDRYVCLWDDSIAPVPSQTEIEAQGAVAVKQGLKRHADKIMAQKVDANPAPIDTSDPAVVQRTLMRSIANTRKESRGRPSDTSLLDALEGWYDSAEPVYQACDAIKADIEAGIIATTSEIDTDQRWP